MMTYDAVIVGSGAAGGIASYVLSKKGLKVLLIEAGRDYNPATETRMFESFAQAPLRGAATPQHPSADYYAAYSGGWVIKGEPYVVQNQKTGAWQPGESQNRQTTDQSWMWWRSRMLGGRTNQWGRQVLRMSGADFKPYSMDGLGFDWPIGYADVAPYYSKVEELIGVFGNADGLDDNPDHEFLQPPPRPRAFELIIGRAAKAIGRHPIASRRAILTKPLNGRAACLYATSCTRGCSVGAAFQSPSALISPALATGNLTVITDTMVREIVLNEDNKATGVICIDKQDGSEIRIPAKNVILAAGACESARILLNTRNVRNPQGLGNSSGHLGRWLTDSTGSSSVSAQFPALEGLMPYNDDGIPSVSHLYIPWTKADAMRAKAQGVPRGFGISWVGGRTMPSLDVTDTLLRLSGNSWGEALRKNLRRYYGSVVSFNARGEMIPNERSFCELDPNVQDQWGIPTLRFHFEWGEPERKQAKLMEEHLQELIQAAGGVVVRKPGERIMTVGGSVNHEVGVCRMSARAQDGVTDPHSRLWDSPNVIVADGGVFVSHPDKKPTLTIMALAWRACEKLCSSV